MVGRRIGNEFVLVPLAGRGADLDAILNLNRVAEFVWEQLDGTRSGGEVVDAVLGQFEVERTRAERDYLELVEDLVEADAVKRVPVVDTPVVDRSKPRGLGSIPP
jgi:methyltransferase-like protein